jgi:hypothetical protein
MYIPGTLGWHTLAIATFVGAAGRDGVGVGGGVYSGSVAVLPLTTAYWPHSQQVPPAGLYGLILGESTRPAITCQEKLDRRNWIGGSDRGNELKTCALIFCWAVRSK